MVKIHFQEEDNILTSLMKIYVLRFLNSIGNIILKNLIFRKRIFTIIQTVTFLLISYFITNVMLRSFPCSTSKGPYVELRNHAVKT